MFERVVTPEIPVSPEVRVLGVHAPDVEPDEDQERRDNEAESAAGPEVIRGIQDAEQLRQPIVNVAPSGSVSFVPAGSSTVPPSRDVR